MRLHRPLFINPSLRPGMAGLESAAAARCIPVPQSSVRPASGQRDSRENRPVIGLALSGGGTRRFAYIGAIDRLRDMNVPIDHMVFTR